MKQQNQFLTFARFSAAIAVFVTRATFIIALGGWLVLDPASARSPRSPSSFTGREVDFQASPAKQPPPAKQSATPTQPESYLVYINQSSALKLQQVQTLEPTAFVRQYQGRSIIQAGVFSQNSNALNLANTLEFNGIDARIISLTTGKDFDFVSNQKFYFVVIPAKPEKLALVENQVKQLKMGMPINISQQQQPRSHVRLGPFIEREQAENWKRYLKASGLRKVKVYYGK